MAITVKYLTEELGIDKEVAEKIFAERGKEITAEKERYGDLEKKLGEKETSISTITKELEALKETNADAGEWKEKFEKLQKEIKEKEEKAKEDQIAKEKAEAISNRFAAVLGEKKFSHDAIKADYLKKFGDALELEENKSKSDVDIFNELTKDDGAAFVGVQTVQLKGNNITQTPEARTDALRRAMGITTENKGEK